MFVPSSTMTTTMRVGTDTVASIKATTMRRFVVWAALLSAWPCSVAAFQPHRLPLAAARTTRSGRQLLLAAVVAPDDGADSDIFNLLEANQRGKQQRLAQDRNYFGKLRTGRQPKCLWIGCADARVPSDELLGQDADNIFLVRNVANLAVPSDLNLLSVVEYAVNELNVKDIVVCGHYDCESLRVATQLGGQWSPLQYWLRNVEDVYRLHHAELEAIADPEQRHRRLVELNVVEQCNNLYKTGLLPRGPDGADSGSSPAPQIHACVFDAATGDLRLLSPDGSALIGPAESDRSGKAGGKASTKKPVVESPKTESVAAEKATKEVNPPKQPKEIAAKPVAPAAAKPFPFKVSPFAKKPIDGDDKKNTPAKQVEGAQPPSPAPAAKGGKSDALAPAKTAESPAASPGQSPFFAEKKKKNAVETNTPVDKKTVVASKVTSPDTAAAKVNPLETVEPRKFWEPPLTRESSVPPPPRDTDWDMRKPRFGPPETSQPPSPSPGRSIVDVIASSYDEANSWWGKTFVVNKEQVQTYVKTRDPSGRRGAYFAPEGGDASAAVSSVAPPDTPAPDAPVPRTEAPRAGPAAAPRDPLPVVDPFLSPTDAWWNQGDVFRKDQVQTYVKQSLPNKRGDSGSDPPAVDEPGEYFESSDHEGAVAEYASSGPSYPDEIRADVEGMEERQPRERSPMGRGPDERPIPRRVDLTGTGPDSWWEKSELFKEDQVQTFLRKRKPE